LHVKAKLYTFAKQIKSQRMEQKGSPEKVKIKRSNKAPDFPSTIALSRSQLIIERYIQNYCNNLEDYIRAQRIIHVDIDTETLRTWYPTKNWKRDVEMTCTYMMSARRVSSSETGFLKYTLLSYAELDDTGLHINIDPDALKMYIIAPSVAYTTLDYDLTKEFKSGYTHQFYWLACKNDNPLSQYHFSLSPAEINALFGTNYPPSQIKSRIVSVVESEINQLFNDRLIPFYFTILEERELSGKATKIARWVFSIHNELREGRNLLAAKEAYENIDKIITKFLPKYRINILPQIRLLPAEKISQLNTRLEKFIYDLARASNPVALLYFILQRYGIDPRRKQTITKEVQSQLLFSEEEDITQLGVEYWVNCLQHIEETPNLTSEIKEIFGKLKMESYTETEDSANLTFLTAHEVYEQIETYYIEQLAEVLHSYFPLNLNVFYTIHN
jgi:hypothetical protein